MSEISKTADKAIGILIELADLGSASPHRLSLTTGLNRTVVQRLLTTLLQRGFVVRDSGEYSLAGRMRRLGASVQPTLRRAAADPMISLSSRTGETVVLLVADGGDTVVIAEAFQSSHVTLQARHEVGARSPLTQTASGLAILSALEPQDCARALRHLESTDSLLAELETIRSRGVAVTTDELQAGVSGMAVPLRRAAAVVGSLAILAPTSRANVLDAHRDLLVKVGTGIERTLV